MDFSDKKYISEGTKLTWPIKLLYYIAGQISMFLIGWTFLVDSLGLKPFHLFLSVCMIAGAIVMTRIVKNEKLVFAVGIPLFFIGNLIFHEFTEDFSREFRIYHSNFEEECMFCVLVVSLIFSRSHFLRQIILLAIVLFIPIIYDNDYFNFYYAIILLVIYGMTILSESRKASLPQLYVQYIPTIRFCLVVSSICYALASPDKMAHQIICALCSFAAACFLLSKYKTDRTKTIVSIGMILLGCIASGISPNVSLAVLGMILTFAILDYFGVVALGVFLIYSISRYYYDLDMLLNHKSYLLMGSGLIFLILFYLIKKVYK